jgi:hypothetical protein
MHPFVRDLYKRVIHVGREYPSGMEHVRAVWKAALRNPQNCPACYQWNDDEAHHDRSDPKSAAQASSFSCRRKSLVTPTGITSALCEEQMMQAVNRGRFMVKEMVGVIQVKKYRVMKQRYSSICQGETKDDLVEMAMRHLENVTQYKTLPRM